MSLRIIPLDEAREPLLDPDLVWDGTRGDVAAAGLQHPTNPGGLRSGQSLATGVLICLMTDARVDPAELPPGETNRGWPGDAFDMEPGEVPLGSKLWLLRRRHMGDPNLEILAADYARQALQTLIDQGAVARVEVEVIAVRERNLLILIVDLFGRDGARVYHGRFAVLWEQLHGVDSPLAP